MRTVNIYVHCNSVNMRIYTRLHVHGKLNVCRPHGNSVSEIGICALQSVNRKHAMRTVHVIGNMRTVIGSMRTVDESMRTADESMRTARGGTRREIAISTK